MPEQIPAFKERFGYGGFIKLEHVGACRARMVKDDGKFFREIESNCWSPLKRIEECDEHGVSVQVLSTIPVLFNYWAEPQDTLEISRYLNDHIANIVSEHPTRFVGLGTLPMQAPHLAVKELERCMGSLGLAGVQIGSHIGAWNLDREELFPVFEAAESLGAAVFIHPWDMMGKADMSKYWLPWLVGMPAETSRAICSLVFGGVLHRLPNLRIAFAHGGGTFPTTIGRIQHGYNVRPDLCAIDCEIGPREFLGKFFVDSLVHDPRMLSYLIETVGEDNIALGSDYPFPLGELIPGQMIESMNSLTESTRRKLLVDNALRWLGMSIGDLTDNSPRKIEKEQAEGRC